MLKHCEQCGKEFNIVPARVNTARFCSRSCRRGENSPTWKGGKVRLSCEFCGEEFEVSPYRAEIARFCSRSCHYSWKSESLRGESHPLWKEKIKLHCEICGKEFEVTPFRAGARFCSQKCVGLWKSEIQSGENHPCWQGGKVKLNCEQCEKEFEARSSENRRFCSQACMGLWKSENLTGENNPLWKERTKKICEWCSEGFEVEPSRVDKARFCSQDCCQKYRHGEKNPAWRGGISFKPYGLEFDDNLRKQIRERDAYTCAICDEFGRHVHHINYCKADNGPENLITLCISCHGKTGGNRGYYKVLLSPIAIARTTEMWAKNQVEFTAVMENTVHDSSGEFYGGAG